MPPSPCFEFLRAATLIILLVLEYRVSSWQAVRDAQGLHAWSSAALQPNLSPVRTEAVLSAPVCCFFWCLHTLSILISFKSILNIYLISLYRANKAEKHRQNSDALFLNGKTERKKKDHWSAIGLSKATDILMTFVHRSTLVKNTLVKNPYYRLVWWHTGIFGSWRSTDTNTNIY